MDSKPPTFTLEEFPDADFTLVTKDEVSLRVYGVILRTASPVFRDMLSMPQPSGSSNTHDNRCKISEDSETMILLLRLVYPYQGPLPESTSIGLIHRVLKASVKYLLDAVTTRLSDHMEKWMLATVTDPYPVVRAVVVYAAACGAGLKDLAYKATAECLKRGSGEVFCETQLISGTPISAEALGLFDNSLQGSGDILRESSGWDMFVLAYRQSTLLRELKATLVTAEGWDSGCEYSPECPSWLKYVKNLRRGMDTIGYYPGAFTPAFIMGSVDEDIYDDGCWKNLLGAHHSDFLLLRQEFERIFQEIMDKPAVV